MSSSLQEHSGSRRETLRLKLASRFDALEAARLGVLRFLAPHHPSPRALYAVELVLEEALTNTIKYAFPDGANHEIDLTVGIEADGIVLRFEDDGVAFDPLQAPPPRVPSTIEEAVPGGLGIALLRRHCSAADYRRLGDRNVLTVRVSSA
jgi:anti-sigma regulatory factor (Ser/Thr protein kinase)